MTAPAEPGTYRYSLNIATALKDTPAIRVPVLVSVSKAAAIAPDVVDFGRMLKGSQVTRQLRLNLQPGTRLESITAKPAVVDAAPAQAPGNGSTTIVLHPNAHIPFGPARGELAIKLAGAEPCVLAVPFRAYLTDATESEQRTAPLR